MPLPIIRRDSAAKTVRIAEFCELPVAKSPTVNPKVLHLPRAQGVDTNPAFSSIEIDVRRQRPKSADTIKTFSSIEIDVRRQRSKAPNSISSRSCPEPDNPPKPPSVAKAKIEADYSMSTPDLSELLVGPLLSAVECANRYQRSLASVRSLVARADRYADRPFRSPIENLLVSSVIRGAARRIYFHQDRLHAWIEQTGWCRGKPSSVRLKAQQVASDVAGQSLLPLDRHD